MRQLLRVGVNALVATVVLVAALTILGAVLGLPMGVVYVETESMSPTITPGEGFVLVPAAVAGPLEPGDVIVFEAQKLRGGGPTTHRIVGETEHGYITQGDNNNIPDQATSEPPVTQAQIAGKALEIDGRVITIPYTGVAAATADSFVGDARQRVNVLLWRLTDTSGLSATQSSYVLTGVLLLLYGIESFREGRGSRRVHIRYHPADGDRDSAPLSAHTILIALTLVVAVAATAAMVVPSGTHQYDVVASETESPVLVGPGETTQITHQIGNSPILPMVVFLEGGNGVQIGQDEIALDRGGITNVSIVGTVPDAIGHHRFYVIEHRYIAVLPQSVIQALHARQPWLAVVIITMFIAMPYYLLGRLFLPEAPFQPPRI